MILSDKTCYEHILKNNITSFQSSDNETLWGIITGTSLTFKKRIDNLVRETQYKLHALRRIRTFFTVGKAKKLSNAFIESQINYACLIWMFCKNIFYCKIE